MLRCGGQGDAGEVAETTGPKRVGLASVGFLLLVALGIAMSVGISVSLDPLREEFEAMASSAIDRKLSIEGSIEVVPTWWPTLEPRGVRIGQPKDWPERPCRIRC
jgi:hypothetical protein